MQKIILFILLCYSFKAAAQERFTISGYTKDATNGEDIPFVNITIEELPGIGTMSNAYGFYSLSVPEGSYTIVYQFIGYETIRKELALATDQKLNIELNEASQTLEEVVVTAEREDQNVTRIESGITQIDMKDMKAIPAFGGEPDVMRVVQMTPGVKTAGEGSGGFYVRGGGLDQNLILLDEAPVYNPSHLFGFFSVFNGDALKSTTVYKGGMLPEYGGRTASVLDIRMKDGNSKDFGVSGGLGLIASRLTVEGPIVKEKGSFMLSGRRTYADLFLPLAGDEALDGSNLYFYDLNLKANYQISEKDRIYISGYFGRDELGFDDVFGLDWGNTTGTLRWNHLFSNRLFSNTSLIYSDYDYQTSFGQGDEFIGLQSVVKDINLKQDFSFYLNEKNTMKFGFNIINHTIEPGNIEAGEDAGLNTQDAQAKYGIEGALYWQNEQKINNRLSLGYGLRYSLFQQLGEGQAYTFNDKGDLLNTTTYDSWEPIQYYGGLEPRLAVNYLLDERSSLKFGYNRNYQYIHLLSNSTASTPVDTWIMSSNNVKPQIADQVSLGYFKNFSDNMYETSAEVYYKDMQNTIDYRTGANTFLNELLEGDLVYGDGEAYGLELFVKKKKGRLTGWIGYTLSRTTRQFDEINNGEPFSARQDRTHDLSIVAMYKLTDKTTISGNFVYYTGDAVTFPSGQYNVNGTIVPYYTERNGYRMPDYHRLDLALTIQGKKTKRFESSWNFSLYNVYGRENAFSINFQPSEDDPTQTEAVQLSLFKWVPSVTYNFSF